MFFKQFASKNQLLDLSVIETLVKNGLVILSLNTVFNFFINQ